jgi:hypothetical protein
VRLSIFQLRPSWDSQAPIEDRLLTVGQWIESFGGARAVEEQLGTSLYQSTPNGQVNEKAKAPRKTRGAHIRS